MPLGRESDLSCGKETTGTHAELDKIIGQETMALVQGEGSV